MKILIPARVISYLTGTQAWAELDRPDPNEDPESLALMQTVRTARRRKDGSATVAVPADLVDVLYEYAEAMAISSADDAGWDADARADMNSGRACLRRIETARAGARP